MMLYFPHASHFYCTTPIMLLNIVYDSKDRKKNDAMNSKTENSDKVKGVLAIRILPPTRRKLEQMAAECGQTTSKVTAAILDQAVAKCTRSRGC
jgi:hypothetical protein